MCQHSRHFGWSLFWAFIHRVLLYVGGDVVQSHFSLYACCAFKILLLHEATQYLHWTAVHSPNGLCRPSSVPWNPRHAFSHILPNSSHEARREDKRKSNLWINNRLHPLISCYRWSSASPFNSKHHVLLPRCNRHTIHTRCGATHHLSLRETRAPLLRWRDTAIERKLVRVEDVPMWTVRPRRHLDAHRDTLL